MFPVTWFKLMDKKGKSRAAIEKGEGSVSYIFIPPSHICLSQSKKGRKNLFGAPLPCHPAFPRFRSSTILHASWHPFTSLHSPPPGSRKTKKGGVVEQ